MKTLVFRAQLFKTEKLLMLGENIYNLIYQKKGLFFLKQSKSVFFFYFMPYGPEHSTNASVNKFVKPNCFEKLLIIRALLIV